MDSINKTTNAISGNFLKDPVGATFPKKQNSVLGQYTSKWDNWIDLTTEVKLLEEFSLKNGAQPNVANQVLIV